MAGARHDMCELTLHGMAGERHGHGMDTAWTRHGMYELAFNYGNFSVTFSVEFYGYNQRSRYFNCQQTWMQAYAKDNR
jgi:hypothetical protein